MEHSNPCVIILCLLAIFVPQLTAEPSGPATSIEQPATEDATASNEEEMSDARAGAIILFWLVSFVLFIWNIKRLVQFWLVVLLLASLGILMMRHQGISR